MTFILEGQPLDIINELSMYVLKLLIQEKIVSQKTMIELKQVLGIADQQSSKHILEVNIINNMYR